MVFVIKYMVFEIVKCEDVIVVCIVVKFSGCFGYMYEMELVFVFEVDDIELNVG